MESKGNVLMAVCNYFNPDNRVFRAADTIQKLGYSVVLLAYWKAGLEEESILGSGFSLKRIKTKSLPVISKQLNNFQKTIRFRSLAKQYARVIRPDIVHCHDYNTLFLGIYCKRKFGSRLIYDCHEYFQDLKYLHRYPFLLRMLIAYYERRAIRKFADGMIVVSPGLASLYKRYTSVDIRIIRNIPDFEHVKPDPAIPERVKIFFEGVKKNNYKVLLYLGTNTQKGRGIEFIFQVLKDLPREYCLVSFGAKSEQELDYLMNKSAHSGLTGRFQAFYSLSTAQLIYIAQFCYLGLSLIEPLYVSYYYSLPNKLFEYIQMGLPVLTSDIPDQKEIVIRYKVGAVIPFEIEKAREIIQKYKPDPKKLLEAKIELNWQTESERFKYLGY